MFSFSNINEYQLQLATGDTTCVAAVEFYLEKIAAKKHLNAFVEVFSAEALQRAALLDEKRSNGLPMGRLHGVVIAIKDVICYKGHTVTASSAILKGFTSLFTAAALQSLLDEEAIVIGNCNCDEFAMGSTNENSVYGKVLNALDETKVPGGSSGGSAVAVQADMCMCSLGSDTGGSVRQPADFCGIVGFKPGYGTISRYGLVAYASSFDQIGIFGNNIADVRLLFEIMHRADPMDSTMLPIAAVSKKAAAENLRVCFFPQMMSHPSLDVEISNSLNTFLKSLAASGHTVSPVDFDLLDYIVPAYYVLTTAEASSNLSRYDGVRYGHRSTEPTEDLDTFYKQTRSEGFGIEVKRRILLGTFVLSTGYYDAYYTKAQKLRRLLIEQISAIFENFDVIVMPTVTSTAMPFGTNEKDPIALYLADIFTVFANLTGIPGISLPLFKHSNNMPFGAQILTNRRNELTLLDISDAVMKQFRPESIPVDK